MSTWKGNKLDPYLTDYTKINSKRQAGTWDPLLQGLHLDEALLEQQIQRDDRGLKVTVCVSSWGNYGRQDTKTAKTQLPLQKQRPVRDPCTQHHQGGGQTT